MADLKPHVSGLLDLARAGDADALAAIFRELNDPFVRIVTALVRDDFAIVGEERSETGLVSDLWVRMLTALQKGLTSRTTDEFVRMARVRARRLLLDEVRRIRRRRRAIKARNPHGDGRVVSFGELAGEGSAAGFEPVARTTPPDRELQRLEFLKRAADLPPDLRVVFFLRFKDETRYEDIAAAFGITESVAKKRYAAAVRLLGDHIPDPDS